MSLYREAEIGEDFVEPSSLSSHRSYKIGSSPRTLNALFLLAVKGYLQKDMILSSVKH